MLVSIQAGNSDNKLTQQDWADFVYSLDKAIAIYEKHRHFFGGSVTWAKWQNVCWVVEIDAAFLDSLKSALSHIRTGYQQDSVCVLAGDAMFV